MAGPELSVVCRNCGSEVSPYVTECPYCGNRLRKRAPKLQRDGDEIRVREGRREKKLRRDAERRAKSSERRERYGRVSQRTEELATKPVATGVFLIASAIYFIIGQVLLGEASDLGGDVSAVGQFAADASSQAFTDPQRYLLAPFYFEDAGYLFICGLAIAIFMPPLERRIGSLATLILGLGCGALGILAADGLSSGIGDGLQIASGANGIALGAIAAYVAIREPERRADPEDSYDPVAVGIAAAAVLAISFIESFADPIAALAGGLVGLACGFVASRGATRTQ